MSILVEHVTKLYGTQKALDDVSFEVKKGEILGFLGPNGAGKSTMMKIITCFIPPTSGSVKVGGYDIESESMKVRSLVGYLPENNPLYYDMYVKEYLELVCGFYGIKQGRKERVAKMIEVTGLGREQHKLIGQLSKGYKQRVGIAQALIHEPEILILDEPTSGLDPNQLVDIRELIKNLGREKTVMFSSHIMQEVEAVSDRIIIIDKGKLVTDRKVRETSRVDDLQSVIVEFESEVGVKLLKGIGGVKQVEAIAQATYRIVAASNGDFRKTVSEWARNQGLLVLTLKVEDQNLEDIFRQHTK